MVQVHATDAKNLPMRIGPENGHSASRSSRWGSCQDHASGEVSWASGLAWIWDVVHATSQVKHDETGERITETPPNTSVQILPTLSIFRILFARETMGNCSPAQGWIEIDIPSIA